MMPRYFHELMRAIERMSIQHWVLVFIVAVLIGIFCMRGFGSRSSY